MVKVRLNTADVAAEACCLKRLIGMRCANVYDLTPKTYVIKLAKSSGLTASGEGERVLLLLESGVRLHTTEFSRDKSATPSGFTLKLRKHIRTRRLENVSQLGIDRVVDLQFGVGEMAHHIILELYAQGNVILTDADYNVLTLLRSHRDDNKGLAVMARHQYPIGSCRTFQRTSMEKLKSVIASVEKKLEEGPNETNQDESGDVKLKSKKDSDAGSLKMALGETFGYGPALFEHIILAVGLQPNVKLKDVATINEETYNLLYSHLVEFENWLENLLAGTITPEGFIFFQKKNAKKKPSVRDSDEKVYDEFSPLLLNQFSDREHMKMDTFDSALDEYFSKIEGQRLDQQRRAQEDSAFSKLEKIRADQRNRVELLKRGVDQAELTAELIEYNLADVDLAIEAVRTALANGMDWKDLGRMIKDERKAGNPVAGLIHSLQLERNQITLFLSNNLDDMDDDERTTPVAKVEVDLALSAHANARKWYESRKKQALKQEKTVAAHDKAFKAAEKKTQQQLSQAKTIASISHIRKVHWFEKFNWFISSENYLIISGRDAQQNELVVKRYMKSGDLYVHADLHGASSTIIKNHRPREPIPPLTINQAGSFTVCRSQAWDSKIVTSAWWVYDHQVSKTAPTGEYLTVGSFMVRGKKNFLPPYPLVMGFGLLFRLDESSIPAHFNERRIRAEGDVADEGEKEEEDESLDEAEGDTGSDVGEAEIEVAGEQESNVNAAEQSNADTEQVAEEASEAETAAAGLEADEQEAHFTETEEQSELDSLLDKALELKGFHPSKSSLGKYDLDVVQQELQLPSEGDQLKASTREKPYISKAERRRLKKGTSDEPSDRGADKVKPASEAVNKVTDTGSKMVRGKKGKLKKLKKYAEQDEEERELRMSLLSSAGKKDNPVEVAPDKEKKRPEGSDIVICYKCKKAGHVASDCQEDLRAVKAAAAAADTEVAVLMAEENIVDLDDEDRDKLTELDSLTGNPVPDDILLYAVPVCGPYNALQNYKYHVKLVPGPSKKGKGAKAAMNAFIYQTGISQREKELMKAVGDPDMVACMIGNVKVSTPGLAKLKQTQKKTKKQQSGKKVQ